MNTLATYTYTIPGQQAPLSAHEHYASLAHTLFMHMPIVALYQKLSMHANYITPWEHRTKKDTVMQRHLSKPMSHPDRQKFARMTNPQL